DNFLHKKSLINVEEENRIIVSFTSFPARMHKIWMVVESIRRQSLKPDKIILWLSKKQFKGDLNDLPKNLLLQMEDGLQIEFVDEDLRSHKKYYYAFERYADYRIILIDDDILYSSETIKCLFNAHKKYP